MNTDSLLLEVNIDPQKLKQVFGDSWLDEWSKGKFDIGGKWKGSVYGNTEWAIARAIHSSLIHDLIKNCADQLHTTPCQNLE